MQNLAELDDKDLKSENGLQNLVKYYKNIFETEENIYYYNADDYQNAKRKFVKYLLKKRLV